jgi:hypothetical protein
MIKEKHMDAIREARGKLRELNPIFEKIWSDLQDELVLLPEQHWWGPIEDDLNEVITAIEDVEQQIANALEKIEEVTGEEEEPTKPRYRPLPPKPPTKDEVFTERRRLAEIARKRQS